MWLTALGHNPTATEFRHFGNVATRNLVLRNQPRGIRPLVDRSGQLGRRDLFWLRDDTNIGLWRLPALRVALLRFFVRNRTGNDHILTRLPIDGCGDLMFRR